MQPMYYIGLDVHKQKISYCVKDGGGKVFAGQKTATGGRHSKVFRREACQVLPLAD